MVVLWHQVQRYNRWGVKSNGDHSSCFPVVGSFDNKSSLNLERSDPVSEKMSSVKHSSEIVGWPEDGGDKVLIATLEYEVVVGS